MSGAMGVRFIRQLPSCGFNEQARGALMRRVALRLHRYWTKYISDFDDMR
jgi:hypothetical protein